MNREFADEARELVASARAWLAELHEEGVDAIEPVELADAWGEAEGAQAAPPVRAAQPTETATGDTEETAPTPQRSTSQSPAADPAVPARRFSGRDPAPAPAAPAPEIAPTPVLEPSPPQIVTEVPWGESPSLTEVREFLGDCTRCSLHSGRKQIVFGDGNPDADLMFVGEGPGQQEDETGLPFVGRAGELLTQMIEKGLGIERSSVYICNIVKCRPPNNRTPLPDEVASCRAFLDGQIAAVKPQVIVALGKPAASLLLGRQVAITRVRGSWQEYQGIPLMPTFHPAYILRSYTPQNRRLVWEDLKAAYTKCGEA